MVKLIGITSENPDGAKRTRTADPLHAMQVLYQLSYGPKSRNIININLFKALFSDAVNSHSTLLPFVFGSLNLKALIRI